MSRHSPRVCHKWQCASIRLRQPKIVIRFYLTAMGRVVTLTLLALAIAPLYAKPRHPAPVAAPKKTSAASHGSKRASGVRVSAKATPVRVAGRRSVRNVRVVHAPPAPTYQLHPDPDRYVQIQKALVDKGYFKGEPNGEWSDDSTEAMRRFQADQKIDNDGKIDALSLIALGLGPKHESVSVLLTAPPAPIATPKAAIVPPPR